MPVCQNCTRKWSWFDSLKNLLTFRNSMKCNHCGEIQYQSRSSRTRMSLFFCLPILILPFSVMFHLSLTSVLWLEIAFVLITLSIMPLFLKLTNKDEPLW
ncbi:TIGR04104 family putative zinc finger protein [Metabacillus fastidiosus]|uniref:Cxxc_20_cxxc protein n=1 Tax=Metabacillus fastidiosus TaxID=1458 RepID=A0ABU6NZF6_9BACI|nr:TIGR04104 family putative zinc finger protein [Metabacillus fastidiosus]MED4402500.1 hypothetical protein [Metabacillus fastidiosus]MED4453851.1 hypothetical protein [Metabacillus fastidiosus]MED4461787.1 hypothetical protein [Metabacillus fastidiosus]